MKKDTEFKAKNTDESYGKVSAPDMQLGRHERFTQNRPQQPSASRKMKIYQKRQSADNNTVENTNSTAPLPVDYGAYDTAHQQTDISVSKQATVESHSELQISKSDIVFSKENADIQKSEQYKTRSYQERTQFSQKRTDYDFTKENQSSDYSFTDKAEPYNTEHPEQAQQPTDDVFEMVDTETENTSRYFNREHIQPEPPKKASKIYRRHSQQYKPKTKETDYNFTDKKTDTTFKRSEHTNAEDNGSDIHKKPRPYQMQIAENAENSAEPEDYNIVEAVENANTAFDRAEDTKDKTEPKPVKRKKNKRLQQKQRLQTDDNVSFDKPETFDTDKSDMSEHTENPSKNYQFKRAEKAEFKAEKARAKADKAKEKLPHKKKLKKQRLYDEDKKKPKNRLVFEKEVKPQQDLYHRTPINTVASAVGVRLADKAHSKVSEVERDNSAVEGAHKTERAAESLARYSAKTARYAKQQIKAAPYKKTQRLRFKAEKAEVKAAYEKSLAENPKLKKSLLKKFRQKQQIKKQYQKAKQAEQNAKRAKKTAEVTKDAAVKIVEFIKRHKNAFAIILIIAVVVCWFATTISSCAVIGTSGVNSILTSSYLAEDEDIYMAEGYYAGLEADLQTEIDNIESNYASYDEYNYNLAQIGHNPYELISYLTAKYECFVFLDIQAELDNLFSQQYVLMLTEEVERRTDDEGNEYDYKTLNVELVNNNLNMLANTNLTEDECELYGIYLETKGNRDYLFADDIYSNAVTPPSYTIPGEALSDNTFRTLITEAERYLGFPYVWGGSSPSTSFDCSGFVCWVFKNSGVYPLERTTAQGIFNQCAVVSRDNAKPGDIIFFKGTYNTSEVSHVGIYVGDGMMIHCGNPVQYTSINSSYWTQHFYAMGRLGG